MRIEKTLGAWVLALLAGGGSARAGGLCDIEDFQALAAKAVSPDPAQAADAQAVLRARGPEGLEALSALREGGKTDQKRLRAAMDAVACQKDAWASRLFWHTDLEEARKDSRISGRPILSLALLGRLDDEFS